MIIPVLKDEATGRYIFKFNASMYKESNCYREVFFTLVRGLTQEGKDYKQEYGTAFHHCLKLVYGEGQPIQAGIQAAINHYSKVHVPDGDFRSMAHLVNCIMQYFDFWTKTGELLKAEWCEKQYAVPFYHSPSGLSEVLICGTLDEKAYHYGYSRKVIVDHKTTSLTQTETYLRDYEMSPQMMMYKMMDNMLFPNDPAEGCIINGIFLSRTNKNTFKRSKLIEFNPLQMQRFEFHLRARIATIVDRFEKWIADGSQMGESLDIRFPNNYTCCSKKFGMCQYAPLCTAPSVEEIETVIENSFQVRPYDPLHFQA